MQLPLMWFGFLPFNIFSLLLIRFFESFSQFHSLLKSNFTSLLLTTLFSCGENSLYALIQFIIIVWFLPSSFLLSFSSGIFLKQSKQKILKCPIGFRTIHASCVIFLTSFFVEVPSPDIWFRIYLALIMHLAIFNMLLFFLSSMPLC